MDDVSTRKKEIEEKLKRVRTCMDPGRVGHKHHHTLPPLPPHTQSEVQLNDLKESLEKSDQLTNSMVSILDSFTTRLRKLDEAIVPVYQQTRRLTQLQESI